MNDNGYLAPLLHNDMNQYTGINGWVPQYDGNFNQKTTYAGPTYVYNALNQVVGGSMQCTYDGLGRCLRRTIGNTTTLFAYDGWKPVTEYDAAGNLAARNIYGAGPDEILMRGSGQGWFFYHADRQGSITALLGLNGTVLETYTYDAFGRPTILGPGGAQLQTSTWGNRFMFTGREWFSELQVYDYRHRLYNPDTGRFLQVDPLGLQTEGAKLSPEQKAYFWSGKAPEAFGSSEMNLFRYCGDDPVNWTDPFGLLIYRFSKDYPERGPGGRKAIERAIKELQRSKKGREILAADGVATIRPVNREHPKTVTRYSLSDNIFDVYLDPTDSRFQDSATFRALSKSPGELPEDSPRGRAIILGHEFAHGVFKALDEHDGGRNIRDNENAIRRELDNHPLRRSDGDTKFHP
ncbi:MAG TPA: RHS repeat-associated core domain-containing protein [Chthoniobacterales bacterium]|nr:RHS repeat-associated core domain-containing protein [Chthoniobacterales bacterium]